MATDFDIIVIGAGPAGATCARLAAEIYRVLLVDKDARQEKCCDGLITSDAKALFVSFDRSAVALCPAD